MTVEEKAKHYDEAIERANELNYVSDKDSLQRKTVEYIFPELAESEDERIRKKIIQLVNDAMATNAPYKKEMLAWLEKQGEYANFRNKIQIGDKVTRNEDGVLVNLSQLKRVAKPADEKQGEKPNNVYDKELSEILGRVIRRYINDPNIPYTEREKVSMEIIPYVERLEKQGEQKPAWSEEDEAKLKSILFHIEDVENKDVINWFKSLKERYTWKPSDEQMKALSNAGNSFRPFEEGHKVLWSLYNDLEKLKE